MAPMDGIWLHGYSEDIFVAPHFIAVILPPLSHHNYRSATGIGYAGKIYPKWQVIQLAIHPIVNG